MAISTTLLLACIVMPSMAGVLTHSQNFPFVIEIDGRPRSALLSHPSHAVGPPVTIGKHEFACSKQDTVYNDTLDSTSDPVTRIHALRGACWDLAVDTGRRRFFKICMGVDINDYKMKDDRSPGIMSSIAKTDPYHNSTVHDWGIEELFEGPGLKVLVKYQCDRAGDKNTTVVESQDKFEIQIPTVLSCASLSQEHRENIVSSLPRLGMQSQDRFWQYQFAYPGTVTQVHVDPTGATREEKYSLGNTSDKVLNDRTEHSLDPDDPFISKYLEMRIVEGTMCSKHNIPRQTSVRFRCPLDWPEVVTGLDVAWTDYIVHTLSRDKKFKARLASVKEPDICEYIFEIETTALCIDPEFIPLQFEVVPAVLACSITL